MTIRPDGYDYLKWHAEARKRQPRRGFVKWLLAGATAIMLANLVAATLYQGMAASSDLVLLWLPMVIATSGSPFARATWLTEHGRRHYDEFERSALGRATTRAFAALCLGLTAALLLFAGALHLGDIATVAITPHLLIIWATAIPSLGFTLPVLFAEFTVAAYRCLTRRISRNEALRTKRLTGRSLPIRGEGNRPKDGGAEWPTSVIAISIRPTAVTTRSTSPSHRRRSPRTPHPSGPPAAPASPGS